MKQEVPEILRERDIFGLDKPKNQLKPLKQKKSSSWFLAITLLILGLIAIAVYYF